MRQSFVRNLDAAQHSRQLLYTLFCVQAADSGTRRLAIADLADAKVLIGETRDLWQVSDAKYLSVGGKFAQSPSDHFCNTSAYTTVDLVKDHRWNFTATARYNLNRQAHARQLAAGGDTRQRHWRLPGICADQEFNVVNSPGTGLTAIES